MPWEGPTWATALGFVVAAILVLGCVAAIRRSPRKPGPIQGDPRNQPYRIYTRDYDEVIVAPLGPDNPSYVHDPEREAEWRAQIVATDAIVAACQGRVSAWLDRWKAAAGALDWSRTVVVLLVDQSGSMRGEPMAAATATAQSVSAALDRLGVATEILGFSTVGWKGGRPYQEWLANGRPPRPGRVCALLHMIYKQADEAELSPAARDKMLDPLLLRENIDGEALLWARDRLLGLPHRHKLLVVLSDGAPVDDATLLTNGNDYLWGHLEPVIRETQGQGTICLGAVGIGYQILVYETMAATTSLDELADTAADVIERLLADAPGISQCGAITAPP